MPTRYLKQYFFTATTAKDRFVTNDKPTQSMFAKLFDSFPWFKNAEDTATTAQQGLIRRPTDQESIDKRIPSYFTDEMARAVFPHQIPDLVAKNSSIVVEEVIWDITAASEAPNTTDEPTHDYRKLYKLSASIAALDEDWKIIGDGDDFANGEPVPGFTEPCSQSASPVSARLTSTNRVAIRGKAIVDSGAWVSDSVWFTLPPGYRPTVDVALVVGGDGTAYSEIYVNTNGEVIIHGYNGLNIINIPETEFSLD